MFGIFRFLSKLVRARDKTRFSFLDRVAGSYLGLVILAGTLLAMAYVVETRFILSLEFPQNQFEFIP
jgi:hypothetical protein